jgi:hypothetical protein
MVPMPALNPERLHAASDQIRRYYAELSVRLQVRGMQPLPDIRLYVSDKIRRCFGYTAFRREKDGLIVLKIAIAWMTYRQGESMWQDVVAHEAAHAYCMAYHNRADHSPSWRHVAQLLGSTGDLCGCEDPARREEFAAKAEHHPTRLGELSGRDRASLKLSFRQQLNKFHDERRALEEVVRRFPQFEEGLTRTFLMAFAGIAPGLPLSQPLIKQPPLQAPPAPRTHAWPPPLVRPLPLSGNQPIHPTLFAAPLPPVNPKPRILTRANQLSLPF